MEEEEGGREGGIQRSMMERVVRKRERVEGKQGVGGEVECGILIK